MSENAGASAAYDVPPESLSTQAKIILAAEELFASRGLEGVSLRQIGVAAGQLNNSSVQYHFRNKEALLAAIFEYRLGRIERRRRQLLAEREALGSVDTTRALLEINFRPLLEEVEDPTSHYVSFIARLTSSIHPEEHPWWRSARDSLPTTMMLIDRLRDRMGDLPAVLREHRLAGALVACTYLLADAERLARGARSSETLPLPLFFSDMLDRVDAALSAPLSSETRSLIEKAPEALELPIRFL
jgi:AcrR family transcriptional regulator